MKAIPFKPRNSIRYSSKKGVTDSCNPDKTRPDTKECHSDICNNKVTEISSYLKDLCESKDIPLISNLLSFTDTV